MLEQVNLSNIKARDIIRFRESVEVLVDGDVVGILIIPNTDFISDQVKSMGVLSNTCMPDPNRFEEVANVEEVSNIEDRSTADIKG